MFALDAVDARSHKKESIRVGLSVAFCTVQKCFRSEGACEGDCVDLLFLGCSLQLKLRRCRGDKIVLCQSKGVAIWPAEGASSMCI